MSEIGYGSEAFLRACQIDAACRSIGGSGPLVAWQKMRAGSRDLASFQRRLPRIQVPLTDSPSGRMIAEHFGIREGRRWRYRNAQGFLELPDDPADYMSGRRRQAVRTNVGHARRAGLIATSYAVDDWFPGKDDSRRPFISSGPIERWMVFDADGGVAADAILSVDEKVALLHGMVAWKDHARWLLHTAIVKRLCGSCDLLLTNSEDAFLMSEGARYFQRLLGYGIARLRISQLAGAEPEGAPQPAGLTWPYGQAFWRGELRPPDPV